MAKSCRLVQVWVEEKIEKPIEEWVKETEKKCEEYSDWNPLGWVCWVVTFLVKVVIWVVVTGGKWATRIVCEIMALIVDAVQFVVHRAIGLVDFIVSLIGIRPTKYMRLKVFILLDSKRRPIHDPNVVDNWLNETIKIFKQKLNIEIHTLNQRAEDYVSTIEEPAPSYAVFPSSCSISNSYGPSAEYYEEHMNYIHTSTSEFLADLIGYGKGIYAYMIHSFKDGKSVGCSYPVISDYCLIALEAKTTTLAHEICHLCGLFPHLDDSHNLMNSNRNDLDSELSTWQISIVRNSKYVTYLRL
jgi:hypothetical protein